MRLARCLTAIVLLVVAPNACLSVTQPGTGHDPTGTYKVLLVGNSLTYENDLPALLEALADSAGVEDLYVKMVAFPNYALEDHYLQGEAIREIRKGGWRFVVMQQGPSALLSSREHLVYWAGIMAAEIRAVGAIPAFYAVWPAAANLGDFPHVQASYDLAATTTNGALIPAGEAWQAAWRLDATLPLYGGDGFHPSQQGTYLVALVMLQRFYPTLSPIGLPARVRLASLDLVYAVPAAAVPTLQAAAAEAHATYGRPGGGAPK
jgi:hypothetical protein